MNEGRSGTPEELDAAIGRARVGDAEAFGVLYDAFVDRIFRYARIRVGNDLDAEDLTEQVFLRAWQAIRRYEDRGKPFVAWLYAIAGNVVVDHFRGQRARAPLDPNLVDDAPNTDPVHMSEQDSRRRALERAIRRLSPDQQQVVIMRFIEGYSPADVAEAIGKREGTVRVIQHRALSTLRSLLGAEVLR
ncbi:MAG: sigma-70 family RNA polymerase sigma factor [Dehalococcoidia bacterium]